MRHIDISVILTGLLLCLPVSLSAFEIEDRIIIGPDNAEVQLRIISTTDTDVFTPVLEQFVASAAEVSVEYTVVSSSELMVAIHEGEVFDLALSSAMDLQTKLSNDGFTRPYRSSATALIPDWGNWRDHLFAFSQEAAVLVISPAAFEGLEIPKTRQDLIRLLRDQEDRFRGRIGTYDISLSGAGYLFATQDARASESYWRLTEVMGNLGSRLYCCSSNMIEDVATGEIAMAYNALGSYAAAREDLADRLGIVEFEDHTTVMLRTAAILTSAPHPEEAEQFIDHLLQLAWAGPVGQPFPRILSSDGSVTGSLRPIRLGPGLMVYLDDLKRRSFLSEWADAIRRE